MPKKKENYISKGELMKQSSYGFPEIMNKTEASFYLWRNLNLSRLQYLIDKKFINIGCEDSREIITKKELDRYTASLINILKSN